MIAGWDYRSGWSAAVVYTVVLGISAATRMAKDKLS